MKSFIKKISPEKNLISITTYLLIAAVFVRYFGIPEVRIPVLSLLSLLVVLMFFEPFVITRSKVMWAVYLLLQVTIMIVLFLIEPLGDTFSLMLLPACIFVMRYYEKKTGWLWVSFFSVVMAVMLYYGHKQYAPELIVVYLAAYFLVGSYSLLLKQNQAVQEQLLAANLQLKRYAGQVEDLTAINERSRLARELHDSVTQTIFSMTLITRSTVMLQERDPDQVPGKLAELQELAQAALKEMRSLVSQLRPLSISDDGLFLVLEKHIDELNRRNEVQISLEVDDDSLQLDAKQQQEVFRIVQEALNNVIKHAHAKMALVKFQKSADTLTVLVRDDGRGFEPQTKAEDGFHFGLESMRQRAEELSGELNVKVLPDGGTQVTCIIPITEDK